MKKEIIFTAGEVERIKASVRATAQHEQRRMVKTQLDEVKKIQRAYWGKIDRLDKEIKAVLYMHLANFERGSLFKDVERLVGLISEEITNKIDEALRGAE